MAEEQPAAPLPGLSREQKMGFVFLLVFAVIGLILGVLQIRNTLFAPFALTNTVPDTVKDSINDVESLKYRDTDGDGLSDYDETYIYGTSPYLYDTFGYGMSDKEVVEKGLPRCANAGKNCSDASTPIATPMDPSSTEKAVLGTPPPDLQSVLKDPKQVRDMLISSGMKKEVLDKVTDAELMVMVQQLMASSTFSSSTN